MGGTTELERDNAYVQGALETSEVPTLFIDTDAFDPDDWVASGQILEAQLEAQSPGSAAALQERIEAIRNEQYGIDYAHVPMSEVAEFVYGTGPFAIADINVNGQEQCIINRPPGFIDEAPEISQLLAGTEDTRLQQNISGGDLEYNRFVGRHEGEHCNRPEDPDVEPDSIEETTQILTEEVRADRSAIEGADPALAQEIQDVRTLGGGSEFYSGLEGHEHATHSTGMFLDNDENVTTLHTEAAANYRTQMDAYVDQAIEMGAYTGVGANAGEVLRHNPEAYFNIVRAGYDADRQLAIQAFRQNGTYENGEAIMSNLLETEMANSFEGAYRRRILGRDVEDIPRPEYPNFERYFFEQHEARLQAEPAYAPEICSAPATVVSPDGLNMRLDPDQFSAMVPPNDDGVPSTIINGTQITVYDSEQSPLGGVWYEAVTPEGRSGYVSGNYLEVGPQTCAPAAMTP